MRNHYTVIHLFSLNCKMLRRYYTQYDVAKFEILLHTILQIEKQTKLLY